MDGLLLIMMLMLLTKSAIPITYRSLATPASGASFSAQSIECWKRLNAKIQPMHDLLLSPRLLRDIRLGRRFELVQSRAPSIRRCLPRPCCA